MAIDRVRGQFAAPRTRVAQPDQTGAAIAQGLGGLARATSGLAQQQFQKAEQEKAEADRRIREREIADDNAAFINAEIRYAEQMSEVRSQLQNEVGSDGDGYARRVREESSRLQQEILSGLPSYVTEDGRVRASQRLMQLTAGDRIAATEWQDVRAREHAVTTYQESVNVAATGIAAAPEQAQEILSAQRERLDGLAGRLSPAEREALWEATERQALQATIDGLNQRGDFTRAREVLRQTAGVTSAEDNRILEARIEQSEAQAETDRIGSLQLAIQEGQLNRSGLAQMREEGEITDDGVYAALLANADRVEASRRAQIDAQNVERMSRNNAMLDVGISDGTYGREDVELAFQRGDITPQQYAARVGQANSRTRTNDNAASFLSTVQAGGFVNPYDRDVGDGANAVYDQTGGVQVFSEDFDAGMQTIAQFASTGIIPSNAVNALRGMRDGGTREQQAQSLQGIYDLSQDFGRVAAQAFSNQDITEAQRYGERIRAGLTPDAALQMVEAEREMAMQPRNSGPMQVRLNEAREISTDFDFRDAVADVRRGMFARTSGGSMAEQQILNDFQQLFEDYYVLTGDERLARQNAETVISRTVGRSEVNGNMVMQHPPEFYYPNVPSEWYQTQLRTEVSTYAGEVLAEGAIELISDIQTGRDVASGNMPSYAIAYTRSDGVVEYLPGDQRYVFDVEAATAEMERLGREANVEARGERAARSRRESSAYGRSVDIYGEEPYQPYTPSDRIPRLTGGGGTRERQSQLERQTQLQQGRINAGN